MGARPPRRRAEASGPEEPVAGRQLLPGPARRHRGDQRRAAHAQRRSGHEEEGRDREEGTAAGQQGSGERLVDRRVHDVAHAALAALRNPLRMRSYTTIVSLIE